MYLPTTIPQSNVPPTTPDPSAFLSTTLSNAPPNTSGSTNPARALPAPSPLQRRPASRRNHWIRAFSRLHLRVLGVVSPRSAARHGVDLFCTPLSPAPEAILPIDEDGAHLSMLKVDGHDLATYTWGDPTLQPYVLLAHGWSSHSLQYLAWVHALRSGGYAVVAFDQQAHGRSSGRRATLPDFVCNLLAVGWRHGRAAAVIGHSLGGTAAALALKHGLEADRAILIAAQADPEEAVGRFADTLGIAGPVKKQMIALLEADTGVAMDDLHAHRTVPSLGRPALVVHDVEDREVPWSDGERYARHWPHARLLTTSGLGHHDVARDAQVISDCVAFLGGEVVGDRVVSSPNLPYGLA